MEEIYCKKGHSKILLKDVIDECLKIKVINLMFYYMF